MRVAVILTARPSWSKLEPVCRLLHARADVDLRIIACASAVLERYGNVASVIAQDYPLMRIYSVLEGATLETCAIEVGSLHTALARSLAALEPDVVVVCADRHEVLAAAATARLLEFPVVHLQGGERSGSVDDDIRDSVTMLSRHHCVSTEMAWARVYGLVGDQAAVHRTGCPSIDVALAVQADAAVTMQELGGAGSVCDPDRPFLLIVQHPVTSEADAAYDQMLDTLEAASAIKLPRVVFWPGEDAGRDAIAKAIRVWMADHPEQSWHTVRNLPPARFLRLLTQASVLVGNSSVGIREASALGVPVVDIGTRQWGRERAGNVQWVPHEVDTIQHAIEAQLDIGRYPVSTLYGDGQAAARIVEVILNGRVSDRAGAHREQRHCAEELSSPGGSRARVSGGPLRASGGPRSDCD